MIIRCPICRSANYHKFLSIKQVPVHCNLMCNERNAALNVDKGDIDLTLCRKCGHAFNSAFNPDAMEYTGNYENSLHFSERFREYTNWLAEQLIERYSLSDKKITEIGCGQGDFLKLICERGGNTGIGFDPSYRHDLNTTGNHYSISIINDYFSDRSADPQADFIICRQVLEHIYDPLSFLRMINRTIDSQINTKLFFEVPSLLWTLRDLSIWDIIYEHYSYFSPYSLRQLFIRCGFAVHAIYETYEKQFLCIESSRSSHRNGKFNLDRQGIEDLGKYASEFSEKYKSKVSESKDLLANSKRAKKKIVLWGAGSKGVTFLNIMNVRDQIPYVVDINPRKQGMYIPGTGQKIVGPAFLNIYKPDCIIVMNPIYMSEIKHQTNNELGLSVQLLGV